MKLYLGRLRMNKRCILFELKFFETEMVNTDDDFGKTVKNLILLKDIVTRTIDDTLWSSILRYVVHKAEANTSATLHGLSTKLEKLTRK